MMPEQETDPVNSNLMNNMNNMIHELDSINQRSSAGGPQFSQPGMPQNVPMGVGKVYCFKHQDKEIEYFCKFCHTIVCPKCMFSDHNGHELAQLEVVTNIIKQNIYDLNKLMLNTKRINDDNR